MTCLTPLATVCQNCDTGCICVFPYNYPNTLATGASCIGGMSSLQSVCFNNNGLGCDSGGMCINNTCGGASVLSIYKFGTRTNPYLMTHYVGSTNTSIDVATPGPTGNTQPYKMFATSIGRIDTIYLIDHIQGFLSLQYNTESMTIQTPWTQLIPYVTTITSGSTTSTRTLIDVGYNGSTFLVAFDEIVTIMCGPTRQNDTVYIGPNPTSLSAFNVSGTQYTTVGVPLSIDYIDISPPNTISPGGDVLILLNGTIYVKPTTSTQYDIGVVIGGSMNGTQMTSLQGPQDFTLIMFRTQ